MSFFATLKHFYIRKVMEALRNPAYLFMSVFTPLMYLLLFAPMLKDMTGLPGFGGSGVLNVFLPGIVVVLAVFGGLFNGFRLVDEIRSGIIERFRVSPASRLALLLGSVLRDVTNVLIQTLIITLVAIPFGLHVYWGGFLLLLVILAMVTSLFASFSYSLALIFKSEDVLAPIVQGISLPLLLLAGFLLPMEMAPQWLRIAAHFDPVYYAVEAARSLMNGAANNNMVYAAFGVITPLLALVFLWTVRAYRTVVS